MVRQTLYKNAWPKKAIDDIRNLLYKNSGLKLNGKTLSAFFT